MSKLQYYNEHKEERKEYAKKYYEEHKEERKGQDKEYSKEYRDSNKDYFIQYRKKYYEENKQKLLDYLGEKMLCECGFETARCNLGRHQKTKLHLKKLKEYLGNI